jgi:phospholipase/carboxylesterase
LSALDTLIHYCQDRHGIKAEKLILTGFSQGACLTSDYIAQNPARYGGACIFSGGLIGTDEDIASHTWSGELKQTPIYIGCDVADPHIPKDRVDNSASILRQLGGNVTEKIYAGLGHSIHPDGITFLQNLFSSV